MTVIDNLLWAAEDAFRYFADPETATHISFGRIQIQPDIRATVKGYERLARAELMERGIDVD